MSEVEARLAAEMKRVQAAEEDSAAFLSAVDHLEASEAKAAAAPITHDSVEARHRRAMELARSGNWEAALPELLWCYDEGMVRVSEFRGVRVSFLLGELAQIAQNYPPAMAALEERRGKAFQRMEVNLLDWEASRDYLSINRALGRSAETLSYYDSLAPTDRRRGALGEGVYDLLVDSRRYADAVAAKPYSRIVGDFERMVSPFTDKNAMTTMSDAQRTEARRSVAKSAAENVEALAGAGALAQASELAAKILTVDNSEETRRELLRRLERAGHADLLAGTK